MRILISNDDGINAPGLQTLRKSLSTLGEVLVVAPEKERSGAGHGITSHKPLRPKKVNFSDGTYGWSLNGTPADCVKLAVEALMPQKPDIVVSGINRGANLGTDVLYSGTVSAAIEGIINGFPSVAISLASFESDDYSQAAAFASHIVPLLVDASSEMKRILININVPPGKPQGVQVTRLGMRRYINVFHKRTDPRGNIYYWMAGEPEDTMPEYPAMQPDFKEGANIAHPAVDVDIDVKAVKSNYISITPLHFDLTDFAAIKQIDKMIQNKFPY
ncbi:5'/3'-nucleotidase SurE [Desulfoscipio gibsoniae]|uniref:5'-nucleotidase SurE n=1 Tax=Desulfoscipio gibsoniae DSM 7213 TaxID=767817 RepID=R4KFR2_9FIRM|nr:5'/3'-nucleotidase SurE [Desulfoscipio gibsoniae]AGL01444.1 5'/3'-nucleotidase SurE [Desulfoscipio gibsoniae DSM 7213]